MTSRHGLLPFLGLLLACLSGAGTPARAQDVATLDDKQLVVQTQVNQAGRMGPWKDQDPTSGLGRLQALRTGRQSRAVVTFRDGSTVRINESSEIQIGRQRDEVTLRRGDVMVTFLSPGTIHCGSTTVVTRGRRGLHAAAPSAPLLRTAAFPSALDPPAPAPDPAALPDVADTDVGTQVECVVDGDKTSVRCYQGSVEVYPGGADVILGTAGAGTEASLTSEDLINAGSPAALIGDTLRLRSGPNQDQTPTITDYDPATGALTVSPPFRSAVAPGTEFLVQGRNVLPFSVITGGRETRVTAGHTPATPRRTFPKAFASGVEHPWFQDVVPGRTLEVYSDTIIQQVAQIAHTITDPGQPGNPSGPINQKPQPLPPPTPATGGATINIQARPRAAFLLPPASAPGSGGGLGAVGGGLSGAALLAVAAESGALPPALALPPAAAPRGANAVFDLEPYVVGADAGETVGAQARVRVARGSLLGTLATIVRDYRGRGYTDVSEASVLYRTAHEGDFRAGRQLLFLGPANNDRIGSLLISYTVDGLTWDDTAGHRVGYRAGYLRNSGPLGGDNFPGGFGRVQSLLGRGIVGATVLEAHRSGEHLGASADVSQPLGRALNGYIEVGRDPFRRHLFTGGLYFPALFQRTGMNVFLEYQTRTAYQNEASLRVSMPVRPNVIAIGYATDTGHGSLGGGVALQFGLSH